jgi:hypothetical protein
MDPADMVWPGLRRGDHERGCGRIGSDNVQTMLGKEAGKGAQTRTRRLELSGTKLVYQA